MTTYKKLWGHQVETAQSMAARWMEEGVLTAPPPGYNYPACQRCGSLRDRSRFARIAQREFAVAHRLDQELKNHIKQDHPHTI
jgi:hypothetical protein